jgi:alkyl hydroperoxide reductase subunit AhpC
MLAVQPVWASGKEAAKEEAKPAAAEAKPAPGHEEALADDDPDLAHVGGEAPSFRLPAFNPDPKTNGFVALDTFVGSDRDDTKAKVVVLSFMASYCKPCKKEMPYLQQLYSRYQDKGLRVIMVSVDTDEANFPVIQDLIKTNNVTFPILKDRYNLVARRYLGTKTPLPSLFIINPDGSVKLVKRGYNEEGGKVLLEEVQKSLGVPVEALK